MIIEMIQRGARNLQSVKANCEGYGFFVADTNLSVSLHVGRSSFRVFGATFFFNEAVEREDGWKFEIENRFCAQFIRLLSRIGFRLIDGAGQLMSHYRCAVSVEDRISRARKWIEKDYWSDNQPEQVIICEEHLRQAELLSHFGRCEHGCDQSCLVQNRLGNQVCRWTAKPCPNLAVKTIADLFKQINGGYLKWLRNRLKRNK